MSRIEETCGCGARWIGDSIYTAELTKFREAHNACRQPRAEIVPQEISEEQLRRVVSEVFGYEKARAI